MRSSHHAGDGFPLQGNVIHLMHNETTMSQEIKADIKPNLERKYANL
jgi:hypothetical protein